MSAYRKMELVPMPVFETPADRTRAMAIESRTAMRERLIASEMRAFREKIWRKAEQGGMEITVLTSYLETADLLRGEGYRVKRPWWDGKAPYYLDVSWAPPEPKRWWQFWRKS